MDDRKFDLDLSGPARRLMVFYETDNEKRVMMYVYRDLQPEATYDWSTLFLKDYMDNHPGSILHKYGVQFYQNIYTFSASRIDELGTVPYIDISHDNHNKIIVSIRDVLYNDEVYKLNSSNLNIIEDNSLKYYAIEMPIK